MGNDEMKTQTSELIINLAGLKKDFKKYVAAQYYNSQSVIDITINNPLMNIEFTIDDILLIAAITQSNILLSGSSGSGKTYLAEIVSRFLFGTNGFTRKNITPDMNEQDFMDIDFGAIKEGKKLKDAMQADDLFKKPCLIIDEANRAPPIIQNRLMQILENNIDLKSKTVKAGIKINGNKYYHWNILTLNYGAEYSGTSVVDRAFKDRITLDIPIDNFPPKIDDQILMIREEHHQPEIETIEPPLEIILKIYENLRIIPLSIEAEALILYLSFTSNCIKSPTGSKYGVLFSPQFCKENDCPFARNPPLNKICPYTFAPSNRNLRRVVQVAKGFTLLKQASIYNQIIENQGKEKAKEFLIEHPKIEVSIEDIIKIAPLILHSKLSMHPEWVLNKFNGNSFIACKTILKIVYERLDFFMKNLLIGVVNEKKKDTLSEKDISIRKRAIKDDFHYEGLIKYVLKYLS
jgi:dynein-related subfamily AAA family protein